MGLTAAPVPVVVDASFVVDSLAGGKVGLDALERWAAQDRMLLAPAIFWPEVANALLVRRRVPRTEVVQGLRALAAAGIETADRGPLGCEDAVDLAAQHGLTVHDATYLWLAIDIDGELATFDRDLARAALAEGVTLALEA